MNDPHEILNVSPGASFNEIEAAYHKKRAAAISMSDEVDVETTLRNLDAAFEMLQRPTIDQPPSTPTTAPPISTLNTLANMSLASPTAGTRTCVRCGAINPSQATHCQNCFEQLTRPCPHCGHPLDLTQTVCDRCNTVVVEYRQRVGIPPAREAKRIDAERSNSTEYARDVGIVVDAERRAAIRFWVLVIVFVVIVAILVLATASSGSTWR